MSNLEGIALSVVDEAQGFPLLVEAAGAHRRSLPEWLVANLEWVESQVEQLGAVLFRGFAVLDSAEFERAARAISKDLLDYVYRSTPRTTVGGRIYTATEFPAHQNIPMHNENSYQRDWPVRLMFCCKEPAAEGGETPLVSTRKVTRRIDAGVRDRFRERQVMYVRNYDAGVDLSWQTVFQTDQAGVVEKYCQHRGISATWKRDGGLTTRQVCQALASHPQSREELWFNQAHLFHISGLGKRLRESLEVLYRPEDLPRNAYYGDGAPLEEDVLDHIREAYQADVVQFRWQSGDFLLLDNMSVCHSRRPYRGPRTLWTAMAVPYSSMMCSASVAHSGRAVA